MIKGSVLLKTIPPPILQVMRRDFEKSFRKDLDMYVQNKLFEQPSRIIDDYFVGYSHEASQGYYRAVRDRLKEIWRRPDNQKRIKKYIENHV